MKILIIFLFSVYACLAAESYRAAVITIDQNEDFTKYIQRIHDAGKSDVDIILLPSTDEVRENNYDEYVKTLADAAKHAGVYLVAHLYEQTRCQNKNELIRSNLVFDRDGTVIAVYRKPTNRATNCSISSPEITTFKTDFGVTFGLLMEEDLVLYNSDYYKGLKHFVVAGLWNSEIPFLNGNQFSLSWAYTNKACLITHTAIYWNRAVVKKNKRDLLIADVDMVTEHQNVPVIDPSRISNFASEDLSQFITRPLDIEAGLKGYKETVCHDKFCCDFDIKTSFNDKPTDVNYGLAVYDGMAHYTDNTYIGVQICGIYACAGLYKRSCSIRLENSTTVNFDKILISGNFTSKNSAHYPIIVSTRSINIDQFDFIQTGGQVTATLKDTSVLNFGIFSRHYDRDIESVNIDGNADGYHFSDYIFNDSVQEFVDYVWIRLRILIFVVSIYILEMM